MQCAASASGRVMLKEPRKDLASPVLELATTTASMCSPRMNTSKIHPSWNSNRVAMENQGEDLVRKANTIRRDAAFVNRYMYGFVWVRSSTCFCCRPFDTVRRMKKLSSILATVVVLSLAAYAASISGTWNAKVDLGGQGGTPTFVLKQDGEKLTGTYSGALGDAPLTGTVKGNAVMFDFDAQGAKVHYEGKLNADGTQMEGTCDYGGPTPRNLSAAEKAGKKKK